MVIVNGDHHLQEDTRNRSIVISASQNRLRSSLRSILVYDSSRLRDYEPMDFSIPCSTQLRFCKQKLALASAAEKPARLRMVPCAGKE